MQRPFALALALALALSLALVALPPWLDAGGRRPPATAAAPPAPARAGPPPDPPPIAPAAAPAAINGSTGSSGDGGGVSPPASATRTASAPPPSTSPSTSRAGPGNSSAIQDAAEAGRVPESPSAEQLDDFPPVIDDAPVTGGFHSSRAREVDLTQPPAVLRCPPGEGRRCPAFASCGGGLYACANPAMAAPAGTTTPPLNHPSRSQPVRFFSGAVFLLNNTFQNYGGTLFSAAGEPVRYHPGGCREDSPFVTAAKGLRAGVHRLRRAATVAHCYGTNVFHFFVEILPRYFQLLPVLRAHPDVAIVASTELWQWAVDLWFPADRLTRRLVVLKPGGRVTHRLVHASQMFVPVAFPCGEVVKPQFTVVRDYFFAHVLPGIQAGLPPLRERLLFLYQRPSNGSRALSEHDALHAEMQRVYGRAAVQVFHGLYPDRFRETLHTLQQARLLVGPHGAGLTAAVFLPPSTAVLEIRPSRYPNTCYEYVAHACGLRYAVVKASGGRKEAMSVGVAAVMHAMTALVPPPAPS